MVESIRIVAGDVFLPLFVSLVERGIYARARDGEGRVVQKVPQGRISQPLLALDPRLGPVVDSRYDGHDDGIDPRGIPLRQEILFILEFGVGELGGLG